MHQRTLDITFISMIIKEFISTCVVRVATTLFSILSDRAAFQLEKNNRKKWGKFLFLRSHKMDRFYSLKMCKKKVFLSLNSPYESFTFLSTAPRLILWWRKVSSKNIFPSTTFYKDVAGIFHVTSSNWGIFSGEKCSSKYLSFLQR